MDINSLLSQNPYGVIYLITCKVNGKVYVGQTTDFKTRIKDYKCLSCKGQPKIYNALKKYGVENFSYEIIDVSTTQPVLDFLEDFYIDVLGSKNRDVGYNSKGGGSHGKHSEESKSKMSHSHKTSIKSIQHTKNVCLKNIGRPLSEEHKLKIGKANKGRVFSEESKRKISESLKGMKHTEEARKNMSLAHKGKVVSEATCKKRSEIAKLRTIKPETRKKMAETRRRNSILKKENSQQKQ